jgi:hypothetical protein
VLVYHFEPKSSDLYKSATHVSQRCRSFFFAISDSLPVNLPLGERHAVNSSPDGFRRWITLLVKVSAAAGAVLVLAGTAISYASAPAVFVHTQHLPSQIDDACRQHLQRLHL